MKKIIKNNRDVLPLLAVSGAFIFILSSLKMPSITGSCSHPTGTGIGAILFGPWITSVLSIIVLFHQAIFLPHSGLTTLGANTFSMGMVGPIAGYLVYKGAMKWRLNIHRRIFGGIARRLEHVCCYIHTACSGLSCGYGRSVCILPGFQAIFAVTQVPLAIVEGAVSALMFKYIVQLRSDVLLKLNVASPGIIKKLKEASV